MHNISTTNIHFPPSNWQKLKHLNGTMANTLDMPSHKRVHRHRRSKKPLYIAAVLVAIVVIAIVAVYSMNSGERKLTIYTVGQGSVFPGNRTYAAGATVDLIAASESNWTFYGWSGDFSGSSNTTITMNGDKVITAAFVPNKNKVLLTTSMGNITIQLRDDMPITTGNFKNLVQQGKYDGTTFHRIIADFMIQGGQITDSWPSIQDEFSDNNTNTRGTIAMANTGEENSGSTQFFINVANNNELYSSFDTSYIVFGDVIDGMDVADAISKVATDSNDAPLETVTLIKAEFID